MTDCQHDYKLDFKSSIYICAHCGQMRRSKPPPPRRKPLTDAQMHDLRVELGIGASPMFMEIILLYGRAIEQAHGIGGSDE